ncbi:hypothetical protein, partial [Escherichia coli]|uniref:hypothetical protein n=1 Tax=Escherichia coli TaxID=562 RepID=UPI003B767B43
MKAFGDAAPKEGNLFDHQPLQLNNDASEADSYRKGKLRQHNSVILFIVLTYYVFIFNNSCILGANFRDFMGVQ